VCSSDLPENVQTVPVADGQVRRQARPVRDLHHKLAGIWVESPALPGGL